jgi:phytoene dehydrogenase-like protein
MPIPRGGGVKLADALVQLIRDHGGVCETGVDVERVVVQMGRATAVRATNGATFSAERAVVASVTPTQLYERLLPNAPAPVLEGARRFRYGRAEMQIHFALSEPARWDGDERLDRTAIVHVTPGLDGVSKAVNEAERGLLPEEATIVVGQPLTIDPSRAPEGKGLLWIQLQELPRRYEWNDDARERYADRIQERLAKHIPNLESSIVKRVALGPHDLERLNVNLVGGDPYGGALSLDQNFLWRPFAQSPGHRTPVDRLWHIGASTWPGPGLGGGSGTLVAQELLKPPLTQRLIARTRRSSGP